ncbi:MAG TPA: hypothetical protein DDZ80_12330 [Cyanobacteria bacterium UBA8803]|nr:hypothetical protein [Cyanobacteria bacterium UBA9273]HBL59266.1 hypothetical protein [Cyanobacteria bacterium UBA8803]
MKDEGEGERDFHPVSCDATDLGVWLEFGCIVVTNIYLLFHTSISKERGRQPISRQTLCLPRYPDRDKLRKYGNSADEQSIQFAPTKNAIPLFIFSKS